jgi:hypothetical protein
MKTIIIPQKMSGTGSIHDIASNLYDIKIPLRGDCQYAVGTAAYYNLDWTTHLTMDAAVRRARSLSRQGYHPTILGADEIVYDQYGQFLQTAAEDGYDGYTVFIVETD